MAVKLTQIEFVTNTLYWNYSKLQWLHLATFTLNLTSIINVTQIKLDAIKFLTTQNAEVAHTNGGYALWDAWQTLFDSQLQKAFPGNGFKCLCISATLDSSDVKNLLIGQTNLTQLPELYTSMFLDETRMFPDMTKSCCPMGPCKVKSPEARREAAAEYLNKAESLL